MNIIFQINGGIGKCVAATAVCEVIRNNYPDCKLIVISGYPDVFLNNPNVDRCYAFGQMTYFWEEYIDGKDVKVFAHDPYVETDFVYQKTHLIKIWCDMFGLKYNFEQPKIYLTQREIDFYGAKLQSDKPIFVLQTNGGADTNIKYSWARDIPAELVAGVIARYRQDYNIVHVRREDQLPFDGTFHYSDNFRSIAVLIHKSHKRLFMDSFCQHTAAALEKTSTVLWIANKPEVFGYSLNQNLLANPETKKPELKASVYSKFNIGGDPLEFPYNNEREIFDLDKVINSLGS